MVQLLAFVKPACAKPLVTHGQPPAATLIGPVAGDADKTPILFGRAAIRVDVHRLFGSVVFEEVGCATGGPIPIAPASTGARQIKFAVIAAAAVRTNVRDLMLITR